MFNLKRRSEIRHALAESAAISKSQAIIEFSLDGTILTANENFLKAMATRSVKFKANITACLSNRQHGLVRNIANSGLD